MLASLFAATAFHSHGRMEQERRSILNVSELRKTPNLQFCTPLAIGRGEFHQIGTPERFGKMKLLVMLPLYYP
jgi:hypothetical protein